MEVSGMEAKARTAARISLSAVDVSDRTRKDLGDVQSLADSIAAVGLLQPIVVTKDGKLIAVQRRLAAAELLGWTDIPAVVAESVDGLLQLVQAESDENTCRKDFTTVESVLMGKRIEGAIAALKHEAKRKSPGRPKKGEKKTPGKLPDVNADDRRTRTETAKAVGMKPRSYEKAKAVVESGNQAAIDQMNKTGKVDPAFRAVKREQKKEELKQKAKAVAKVRKKTWSILLGDCTQELPKCGRPRLIVADPPYNIGINYGDDFDDEIDEDEYLRWSHQWITQCANALTDDGSIWVIINDEWAEHLAVILNDAGLTRRAWIKWYETFGVNCVNNFNRCSRHILYYVCDPKKFVFNGESRWIRRPSDRQAKYNDQRADPDGKIWDDVWTIPRLVDNAAERIPDFPTQIPLAITRAIVGCASEPGDLVVDPFCGSGSTGHAAVELHRCFKGIELMEQWYELATVRLAGVTPFEIDDI
jgi:DNA modification methylase/ParB-like chromosome segregation protein Spo0J